MNKDLVAYFSASGHTAAVAKQLAQAIGADLFEIKPEIPYTDADLNWQDKNSRSTLEMQDKSSRPAIAEKISDMGKYNRIFLGFPIWWYVAPTIVNTFLESYDLSGKTIVPFATSGGSGMGKTSAGLKASCPNAVVEEGKILRRGSTAEELKAWAAQENHAV